MTAILCPLRDHARATPDAPAVVRPSGVVSYRTLDARVTATAARLRRLGVEPGDRVALYLPNGEALLVLLLALLRARAVACPLSTRLPPRAVPPLLRRIEARLLVTEAEITTDAAVLAPGAVLAEGAGAAGEDVTYDVNQPATLVFTSGSSGTPKAALHSVGNHVFNARGSNENLPFGPGDRWLLALPLYHVGGLGILFRALVAGATVALPAPGEPTGQAIRTYGITHVSLVTTQLLRLLDEDAPTTGLKAILLGGSAIPTQLLERAHARGLPVYTSYGLTEMASQVTTTPPGASLDQLRSSGRVLPYRDLRIAPDGEILVRGATLFLGYVEAQRIRRPTDADGWFPTRDLGRLDAAGFLHVAGRKDHRFVSGGENIQPEEIERVLSQIEGVAQAVVVPVPDAVWGARPVAFVRMAAGAALEPAALRRGLGQDLPRFMIPDAFHPWPVTDEGAMKVDRADLRRRAERLHA